MVIDFLQYAEAKKAKAAAEEAERQAEILRRARLESFLSNMLAELEAA